MFLERTTKLKELYALRDGLIRGTVTRAMLIILSAAAWSFAPAWLSPYLGCLAVYIGVYCGSSVWQNLRWLLRYKRLVWVIEETEPLVVQVTYKRNWMWLSLLEFKVEEDTSKQTVDGNDPELGRLLCLAPITPMNFSRTQKELFENGPTQAEVWIDPESYSVAAINTTVGYIFPESIKKAWHQPQ